LAHAPVSTHKTTSRLVHLFFVPLMVIYVQQAAVDSHTRSVGARSVRALSTLPLEFTYSLMWEFSLRYVCNNRPQLMVTIRYDTRCSFNVRWKADMSQLNLAHGDDN